MTSFTVHLPSVPGSLLGTTLGSLACICLFIVTFILLLGLRKYKALEFTAMGVFAVGAIVLSLIGNQVSDRYVDSVKAAFQEQGATIVVDEDARAGRGDVDFFFKTDYQALPLKVDGEIRACIVTITDRAEEHLAASVNCIENGPTR